MALKPYSEWMTEEMAERFRRGAGLNRQAADEARAAFWDLQCEAAGQEEGWEDQQAVLDALDPWEGEVDGEQPILDGATSPSFETAGYPASGGEPAAEGEPSERPGAQECWGYAEWEKARETSREEEDLLTGSESEADREGAPGSIEREAGRHEGLAAARQPGQGGPRHFWRAGHLSARLGRTLRWAGTHRSLAILVSLVFAVGSYGVTRTTIDAVRWIASTAPPRGSVFTLQLGLDHFPCHTRVDDLPLNEVESINFEFVSLFTFADLTPANLRVRLLRFDSHGASGELPVEWKLKPEEGMLSVLVESTSLKERERYQFRISQLASNGWALWERIIDLDPPFACPPWDTTHRLTFHSPDPLDHGPCHHYSFRVDGIGTATTYRFTFRQADTVIGREIRSYPHYSLRPPDPGHGRIQAGELTVIVDALAGRQVQQSVTRTVKVIPKPCPEAPLRGPSSPTGDIDRDGVPDGLDRDSDGDGIPNEVEDDGVCGSEDHRNDCDGDGVPNSLDPDTENDGVRDSIEGDDANQDGIADHQARGVTYSSTINGGIISNQVDTNHDGWDDRYDPIMGGIPPALQNTDGDGVQDRLDTNEDNDLLSTGNEDVNHDGNWANDDTDGDGVPNYLDPISAAEVLRGYPPLSGMEAQGDTDGDGIPDATDLDDDNDGVLDTVEDLGAVDTDFTAHDAPDSLDLDSDADGVWDLIEGNDANHDGVNDTAAAIDANHDGRIDAITDTNRNGVDDSYEDGKNGTDNLGGHAAALQDTDEDASPDIEDAADDGDLIPTFLEDINTNGNWADDDSDSDGTSNYLDADG